MDKNNAKEEIDHGNIFRIMNVAETKSVLNGSKTVISI
jgi:hypothetical protein